MALLAILTMLGAACGAPTTELVFTGSDRPTHPGFSVHEKRCASCHGTRAEGGVGPGLAGHTVEQVVRQVRAPMGEMPIFPSADLSDEALDALVQYVLALPEAGQAHHHHEHGVGLLAKQEVAQMAHVLALAAIESGDVDDAVHWVDHSMAGLSGSHLVTMQQVKADLEAGDTTSAAASMSGMVTDDVSTRGWALHELVLWLAMNAAEMADHAEVEHQLDHLGADAPVDLHEVRELADAGDLEGVHAVIAGLLGLTGEPHDEETDEAHSHEDVEGHHGDEPTVDDHGEDVHDEAAPDHDDGGDVHDEPVADHDDEGLPPHDHDEVVEPVADHDDEGLPPHDH